MTTAHAVIGANYGDEGKGVMVDYLCARLGARVVVRFNGGAQAGHTVVTPAGDRHVFHHLGAGTFAGADTLLSRFFVCNPILFREEIESFPGSLTRVYVDPRCLVTTPFDMIMNQVIEEARGANRHGSCGVGFGETIERSQSIGHSLTAFQLTRGRKALASLLRHMIDTYVPMRLRALALHPSLQDRFSDSRLVERFLDDCEFFVSHAMLTDETPAGTIIFEGAQGLLLDQDNRADFPHVTRSHTGIRNVLALCEEWGIRNVDAVYVTRTYLTRHGAGPLPGECAWIPGASDDTNVPHPFQGQLRYASLDTTSVCSRAILDSTSRRTGIRVRPSLAVTHCDQVVASADLLQFATYRSYGPSRNNVILDPHRLHNDLPPHFDSRYPNDVMNEAEPDDIEVECAACLAHPARICDAHFIENLPF